MNAPAIISQPALSDAQLATVLENSLYPGANPQSISLAITYCHAAGLDPMQKPVHIVPMWDGKAKRMRDVIMPGVGLYRTQAARTGQYAGVTEPEFGPDVTEELGGQKIIFPAWCKVSVKRMMANGTIVEFAATERWKENYAVKGGPDKSIAPNAMWSKRPYGQLAKCTEAQALRKAFPEMTGSQPTADEMEGKPLEYDAGQTIDNATGEIVKQETKVPEPWPDDKFKAVIEKHGPLVKAGTKTADDLLAWLNAKHPFTAEQEVIVRALAPKEVA
jgi:phage recombination protein Bet